MTMTSWVSAADIGGDPRILNVTLPAGRSLDDACTFATAILFGLSGSRYNTRTVNARPHHLAGCRCAGLGWTAGYGFSGSGPGRLWPEGYGCSCTWAGEYVLPGTGKVDPTTVTVQVDGVTLIPEGSPGEQWHLYGGRRLVRVVDPLSNTLIGWPCCQALNLPLGQQGTWAVTWTTGTPPPADGVIACYELAVEVARFWGQRPSNLPQKVRTVARQGVTVDVANAVMSVTGGGKLGFWPVDMWLQKVNPGGMRRRSTVTSIDTIASATY
jgi:hypothetical protein